MLGMTMPMDIALASRQKVMHLKRSSGMWFCGSSRLEPGWNRSEIRSGRVTAEAAA